MLFEHRCSCPIYMRQLTPLLALFDFCAAFPLVAQAWIFLALNYLGFPVWLRNLVHAVYHQVCVCVHLSLQLRPGASDLRTVTTSGSLKNYTHPGGNPAVLGTIMGNYGRTAPHASVPRGHFACLLPCRGQR